MKILKAFALTALYFSCTYLACYLLKLDATDAFVFGAFYFCFMYAYQIQK
jgi:hypothetical protein